MQKKKRNWRSSLKKDHKEFIKNNKLILKAQHRFKRNNVSTEEINKIALSSNDDRMQSFDSIESQASGTGKDLVSEKNQIKCKSIIKRYKTD